MGKIYFASDIHLGKDLALSSDERETMFIQWLESAQHNAEKIYILGDLFDYWYEYKHVIPRGFDRILSTLRTLKSNNVDIEIFTGNHDMWMKDFFSTELGIPLHRDPIIVTHHNKTLFLGHGDGLGPGDHGYKFLKQVFRNSICQWLFSRIHPNTALWVMKYFSQVSNNLNRDKFPFESFEKEWLVSFSEEQSKALPEIDYFIFGHRHLAIDYLLSNGVTRYINLGDWMELFSYAFLEDGELKLTTFESGPQPLHQFIHTNHDTYACNLQK